MNRLSPTDARRAARAQAVAAGCVCRPEIASRPTGVVEVRHDRWCRLAIAGPTAIAVTVGGNLVPVVVDLAAGIELAERIGVMVLDSATATLIVPDGVVVPPMIAEWADITRVPRPDGRAVRICTISDEQVDVMGGAR